MNRSTFYQILKSVSRGKSIGDSDLLITCETDPDHPDITSELHFVTDNGEKDLILVINDSGVGDSFAVTIKYDDAVRLQKFISKYVKKAK
jgi:hypothetical protein